MTALGKRRPEDEVNSNGPPVGFLRFTTGARESASRRDMEGEAFCGIQ